jgi:carbon-monoxide dehydrogenase large subunit
MNEQGKWVGRDVHRTQDPRLLTGRGKYTDDFELPGMVYAAILRSPHAHARILKINIEAAQRLLGVVAVITGKQAAAITDPLPPTINLPGMRLNRSYALAVDKVVYAGEAVAAVAATDRYIAEDALELIAVEYELLPAVTTIEQALSPHGPRLYPEWDNNVGLEWKFTTGDVDRALAEADIVIEERVYHHRYSGVPLEGRAVLADFDAASGEMTTYMSTQAPHQCRTLIAQILRIPEQKLRVIAPAVGGGFGNKIQVDAEVIPCLLSMICGRPVKWSESRSENLLSCVHSRDYLCDLTLGLRRDGTITAIKTDLVGNIGCDGTNRAAGAGALVVAGIYLPGPYKVANYSASVVGVVSNKAPYGAYRGYGKDVANYPLERVLDIAARRLGMSPEAIRERNFIQPQEFPYTQCTGPLYDSANFGACLRRALEMIDIETVRREQVRLRQQGRYIGVGFAAMLEPSGAAVPNCIFNGYESAVVRVTPEGGVTVLTGIQEIGQGMETTLAQVVADELGVNPNDVKVVFGDTAIVPYGLGSWSSRGTAYGASSAVMAARKVKERILRIAAFQLKTREEDLEIREGQVHDHQHPQNVLPLRELARRVYLFPGPYVSVPEGVEPTLEATATWTSSIVRWLPDQQGTLSIYTTHPSAAFAAVVEVDVATGHITLTRFAVAHDAGTLINPMVVDGQVHGGVVQGISGAMGEELGYDEAGQLLNTGLHSYLLPVAADFPDIEVSHLISPSPFTPLGAKGMGEGGAIGSPAAVVNAVEDALAPFGVIIRETPLSPERILALIDQARQG